MAGSIYQHTVAHTVSCKGIGLHSGQQVKMQIHPHEVDGGIVFKRTGIKGDDGLIPALYHNVTDTQLGTTITNQAGARVSTIEHLMAALWGCGVDNCIIEIDGDEVPIMDGSSEPFVILCEIAGVESQAVERQVIEILKPVRVEGNGAYITIEPADVFSVSIDIDFSDTVISTQQCVFNSRDVTFKTHLCRARTFGFVHEVEHLLANGLAQGGSLDNAIMVDGDRVLNKGGLRFEDEFARHKTLDCIGDFYLAGKRIRGHVHGSCSGHALNNSLLRALFSDSTAWQMIHLH